MSSSSQSSLISLPEPPGVPILNQYDDSKTSFNRQWDPVFSSEPALSDVDIDDQSDHSPEKTGQVDSSSSPFPNSDTWTASDGWDRQSSSTESTLSAADSVTYDDLAQSIDRMEICPYMTQENYIPVSHFVSGFKYELMVRIVCRTSEELRLLNLVNQPSYRTDPWNPAPYLLCTLDRDETDVYTCFEALTPYDQPPFCTVAHYLDLFRQLLEGLTFLHELSIVHLKCAQRASFMIDLSAGSTTSSEFPCSFVTSASQPPYLPIPDTLLPGQDVSSPTDSEDRLFDRAKFPVKYYIVDYSDAVQLSYHSSTHHSSSTRDQDQHHPNTPSPYVNDVRDLGTFFSNVLDNVPELESNFRPLVSTMITGELTADDTRRLFETLCRSLEASVFDVSVPLPRSVPDGYTRSSGSSSPCSDI